MRLILVLVLLCLVGLCSAHLGWEAVYPYGHVEPPYGLTLEESMRTGHANIYVHKDTSGIDTVYVPLNYSHIPQPSQASITHFRTMLMYPELPLIIITVVVIGTIIVHHFWDSAPPGIDLAGRRCN